MPEDKQIQAGPQVVQVANAEDLADAAAQRWTQIARNAIGQRGRFTVALAGGSTPERLYIRLTQTPFASSIDWSRVFIFWGDERFVPLTDEQNSNCALAQRTLLNAVPLPRNQIFPVDTSLPTADDAARAYSQTLQVAFGTHGEGLPVFDLVLLGLGDDGHTASLFPGMSSLAETERRVVASPPGILPPPVERVTLTFPVINAAREVMFLVSGAKKAEVVRELLENEPSVEEYPATGVRPTNGTVTYILDTNAASLLKK